MANLTITIDDRVLKRARLRAMEQDTSVNALLRDFLTSYAGEDRIRIEALNDLLALSHDTPSKRGDRKWTREELHERDL